MSDQTTLAISEIPGSRNVAQIRTRDELVRAVEALFDHREVKIISLGHAGTQLRAWKGLWAYVAPMDGGHFDTNENKLVDLNCSNAKFLAGVIDDVLRDQNRRHRFVIFQAEERSARACGCHAPLNLYVVA